MRNKKLTYLIVFAGCLLALAGGYLLGGGGGFGGPQLSGYGLAVRRYGDFLDAAKRDMHQLAILLHAYNHANGRFPSNEEGLVVLGGYDAKFPLRPGALGAYERCARASDYNENRAEFIQLLLREFHQRGSRQSKERDPGKCQKTH